MKIIYALYRNRNVYSNEDFYEKSSLQAMWWFLWESLYASNIQQGRLISKFVFETGIKISEYDTTPRYEDNSVICEWRYVRRQNGSVYSESSICRQYAVWSKLRIFWKAMHSTFTIFTSAIEESINGYATWKLWCRWTAIKGGGRPTWLLPHTKLLLVPIRFLPLLGRLCSGRFYILTGQMWF